MLRILKLILAVLGTLAGTISVLVFVGALIDPAGAQMANDSDPFGTPPHWSEALLGALVSLAVVLVSLRVMVSAIKSQRRLTAV